MSAPAAEVTRRAVAGRRSSPASVLVLYALLAAGTLLMAAPLLWMVLISLHDEAGAMRATATSELSALIPERPRFENYPDGLRRLGMGSWTGFLDPLANTVVVTALVTAGTVLSSSLVAFAMARVRFRGREGLFLLMLATLMLPAQVTIIPLFLLFRWLGWVDTLLPLVVPAFFGSAFFIFLYRQFIVQIPEALFEAARLDGLGWIGLWWKVVLPLCRPVTAICIVFTFIYTWNDFLGPLVYLHRPEEMTLSVALNSFRNQYGGVNRLNLLMAASLATMLPCILLFIAAQRQFIKGLGAGAVKG
ncbi:MAG: carbohydrate ABC transporter permease [Phycisphaeraceae bacterium]|nr:carbohydrate ABC transporter permease [Phycisphaeraceae bacterium]